MIRSKKALAAELLTSDGFALYEEKLKYYEDLLKQEYSLENWTKSKALADFKEELKNELLQEEVEEN